MEQLIIDTTLPAAQLAQQIIDYYSSTPNVSGWTWGAFARRVDDGTVSTLHCAAGIIAEHVAPDSYEQGDVTGILAKQVAIMQADERGTLPFAYSCFFQGLIDGNDSRSRTANRPGLTTQGAHPAAEQQMLENQRQHDLGHAVGTLVRQHFMYYVGN